MKLKNSKLLIAILYSLFIIATLFIQSASDKWLIFEKPTWNLSEDTVYRPFEVLFSWVALNYPISFPYFNHFIILFCHGFNVLFVYKIIRKFEVSENVSLLCCSIYFLFAPLVFGAVTSIDGTNQTISTF